MERRLFPGFFWFIKYFSQKKHIFLILYMADIIFTESFNSNYIK